MEPKSTASDNNQPDQTPTLPVRALAPTGAQHLMHEPAAGAPYNNPEAAEDGLRLRELWRKVWRRKWVVLLIVLVTTTTVAAEVYRIKAIYQATTTIEIGKDNPMLVKTGDIVIQSDDSDLLTGMFLLRSRPLLEDVVAKLRLEQNPTFLEVTSRRSLWGVIRGHAPKTAKPESEEESAAEEVVRPEASARPRAERARFAPFVAILKKNLAVEQLQGTRLLNLSFIHTDPEMAATVVNGVAENFIERSFQKKTEKFSHTSAWLNRSTRELEAQMQRAEQALANYTRTHNIFASEGKEDLTTTKLAHLHDQLMRAETDRLLKQSLYEEVKQGRVAQLPEAFANTSTATLQARLSELTVTAAQLSVKFGARNPKVVEIQQQIAAIRQEIEGSQRVLEEKLKADYERATRDEGSLRAALERAKSEAVAQNQTAIQFNIFKQNVETAKSLYTDFLQKTSQANVQMAEQHRNVSVAEPAEAPSAPVGPLRLRTIVLAFVLSLAGSIGLVLLLDHLDNTIKNAEDVNRYVRVPTLGVIPVINVAGGRRLLPKRSDRAALNGHDKEGAWGAELLPSPLAQIEASPAVAEAYRMLRTSVLLSAADHPPRTILVTSSQPGEGKTTTSVNTAVSLSQLGARVLIVDADLRRPRVHKIFGADQSLGLSSYLSGTAELAELIQPSAIPNLSVLSSGLVPPNSAELVSSERMRKLLGLLSSDYDHVIIDSSPVGNVTDPVIISRLVDGVILVVHGGRSTREMVRHARQELANVGAKVFGVVLNNVNLQRDGYRYYRHYEYSHEQNGKHNT